MIKKYSTQTLVHLFCIVVLFILLLPPLFAQDKSGLKISGLAFGDYFYKIGGNAVDVSPTQYSKVEKDFQAFQFRRLYFITDYDFNENVAAQFLLEANDGTFDSKDRYGVFVKTAYVEFKEVFPHARIGLGLYPTPTWSWGVTEKIWNYRAIEKTITDFRRLGYASDFGVALRGSFDSNGDYGYGLMIANGSGFTVEKNKYKKYYGVLKAKPIKGLTIEGYVDYEPAASDKNKMTLKGFAAYQTDDFTVGVEAVQQTQKKADTLSNDIVPSGIALFVFAPIPGMKELNVFARFDMYNPNTKISSAGFNENFFVFGFDYMPIKNVHLMPNIWVNAFSDKNAAGVKKDSDVVGRITFFYLYH